LSSLLYTVPIFSSDTYGQRPQKVDDNSTGLQRYY
jgi:hypothetical protein